MLIRTCLILQSKKLDYDIKSREIENETPGTTDLIKKTGCDRKIAEIENKIPNDSN